MKSFLTELRAAFAILIVTGLLLCGAYPALVWAGGQLFFNREANGSLIRGKDGQVYGSSLLGQNFTGAAYFHPRPSAAGANGYDGASSGGSNLGPTSQKLNDLLKERIAQYRQENGMAADATVPADAVTASGSGLDSHISVKNALLQAPRVARERNMTVEAVRERIAAATDGRSWGVFGEPGVNVLRLNLALDDEAAQ
jgi:K+-transporting ATPase ATPase C chain